MPLAERIITEIRNLLISTINKKLMEYNPETENMPFHDRLFGPERMRIFSLLQSLNTTLGMSIWEQIALILAKGAGYEVKTQFDLLGEINPETEKIISKIFEGLASVKLKPNKYKEIELIRERIRPGKPEKTHYSRVDLFLKKDGTENYFDITSAKPNKKEFEVLKIKLLKWTALRLSQENGANVFTRLAIPYNPYYPEPYQRWTIQNLFDLDNGEVLIGEDFWNFVSGGNVFEDLLDLFQSVGEELDPKIGKHIGF